MEEISEATRIMLRRLYNRRAIGGKHLPQTLCLKPLKNFTKKEQKTALREWKSLIAEGIILTKPKQSDVHIFINPRKLKEFKHLIGENNETLGRIC